MMADEDKLLPGARLVYAGPACPRCGTRLPAGLLVSGPQSCATCGKPFEATVFPHPPEPAAPVVRSVLEGGPAGATPCGFHAGNAAESSCSRCGVLMCGLCRTEADGAELCPSCFDLLRSRSELPSFVTRYPNYAGRARIIGCAGCLFYVAGFLTGPAVLYYVYKAWRQKLAAGENDGKVLLVFLAVVGVAQIGFFLFLVFAIAATLIEGLKPT